MAALAGSEGHLAGPVSHGELYAVDASGKNGRMVFGYRAGEMQTGTRIRKASRELAWAGVIGQEPGNERQVPTATASWLEAGDPVVHVKRLDAYTGLLEPVTVGPIAGTGFHVDERGEVRLAFGRSERFEPRFFHREAGGTWKELTGPAGLGRRTQPVGVYDLRLLGKDDALVGSRSARAFLRKALGASGDGLDGVSPARNADRLRAKVLLIHGAEDRRAPLSHAEALRDALAKAGRPPEWHVEPREGHGYYDEAARERAYTRLVAFLREHTAPAKAQP